MSDDRLERALQEMREETVDPTVLAAARARVWNDVSSTASAGCGEFQPDLRAYLDGALGGSRRVLMEDHLSRCPACRATLAEMRGERRVVPMPQRVRPRALRWGSLAAAAVLMMAIVYGGRNAIDSWMAPGGPRATVVAAEGGLYRLPGEALQAGAAIGEGETVRTAPGARAVLKLADGSTVDVNERTELYATAAWSGQTIHLLRGDVVVQAARQRRGALRVVTRDSIASVKGTVFAVSAGFGGSVVSVVEGSVAVRQPGTDVLLSPGQQAASNPALASSVEAAVAWSPDANSYIELLASLVEIERELTESLPGDLRTDSPLLAYLPDGAFAYGAIPNLSGRIGQALVVAEEQATSNAAFGAWWNSETGQQLRQMVDSVRSVSSLLGDEIVFSASRAGSDLQVPLVLARVQPGGRAELTRALEALFAEAGEPASYSVSDDLMVVSGSPAQLAWALGHLGQGAGSPFAAAIRARYQRGAGWLMGIDASPVITMAADDDAPPVELAAMMGLKYLFIEQRAPAGAEENEVTLMFGSPRTGMASWLADAGSGGAAEYLPADALVAGYVSMREPWLLFQEFTSVMTGQEPTFGSNLAQVDETFGAGFLADLSAAMGAEAAFAIDGFSVTGPRWLLTALANSPLVIDSSLQKVMDSFNAALSPEDQDQRIVFAQETVGGRTWSTMQSPALPFSVTWTYDGGYMVAASDRATAERAIATRSGGSPLVWSAEFLAQIPSSAGIHPSAFAWLNTRGALGALSALAPNNPAVALLAQRDPVLVIFDGTEDRIHAASRTRLSGVIMDAMMLNRLTSINQGTESDNSLP